ncbi:hypothetical protein AAFG07_00745 [Bradyrhizobium sp. B097]|uniref:hypothetical protein n=1 Tax=Bradyrhizobium sp. B097 TaxID=3140244 RepID=UPI003183EEE7
MMLLMIASPHDQLPAKLRRNLRLNQSGKGGKQIARGSAPVHSAEWNARRLREAPHLRSARQSVSGITKSYFRKPPGKPPVAQDNDDALINQHAPLLPLHRRR